MSDLTGPAFSEELKQAIAAYRKTNRVKFRAQREENKQAEDLIGFYSQAYRGTPDEWVAHWKAAVAELEQRDPLGRTPSPGLLPDGKTVGTKVSTETPTWKMEDDWEVIRVGNLIGRFRFVVHMDYWYWVVTGAPAANVGTTPKREEVKQFVEQTIARLSASQENPGPNRKEG